MNDFDPNPRCKKCEARNTTFRFTSEYLRVTCCHCEYAWNQKAADDPTRILDTSKKS